jgi:hypothetical protein
MKLIQTTLLASAALPATSSSSSFSELTYGSSPESASSIIDAILNPIETVSTAAATTPSIHRSTVASLNTVVETDFISDGFNTDNQDAVLSVCAQSLLKAQSKVCNEESIMTCSDARDCVFGEACFLNVVCERSITTTTSSTSEFEISHFVMLGTDNEGDTMTLANDSFRTTSSSTSDPQVIVEADMSEFSGSATTISSQVESSFEIIQDTIDNELFLYETPLSEWIPSTVYRFDGFFDGLKIMHSVGVAGKKIYLGANSLEDDFLGTGVIQDESNCNHCFMYGLVNVAAFLAQAMKETIRYDACDENSWDRVGAMEMYPIRLVTVDVCFVLYYFF